ncbi:hypothetical protein CEY16_08410 [Halalkalibacillus sediminis]|uniref:DUF2848 domain-containing protein n=1 Tax=Halalkalibacillus sediminis TaxID=2018042 RepID=A0A2I0QUD0_9BACI|nr:DUF2848 family protein [Halalkalibacillus sediminis]PKR77937.1 hypothetical protein CEY16_08410 [Halalkalibacillus sediminis]
MIEEFNLEHEGNTFTVQLDEAYCIGYTGRNKEKTLEHVKELKEIGVPEPKEIPALYPVRQSCLNRSGKIDVLGNETSGEAEIAIIFGEDENDIYITVGSDHTDRSLETVDINKSKQVCDKPFAQEVWKLDDIKDHWDQLELSSSIQINDEWVDYQNHAISAIMPLEEIIDYVKEKNIKMKNTIIFAGTVPLLNGFKFGEKFEMKFIDPVRKRTITSTYEIKNLEVVE